MKNNQVRIFSIFIFSILLVNCNKRLETIEYEVLKNCVDNICRLELVRNIYNVDRKKGSKDKKLISSESINAKKNAIEWNLPKGKFLEFNDFETNIRYFNYRPQNDKNSNPIKYQFNQNGKTRPFEVTYRINKNAKSVLQRKIGKITFSKARTYLTYKCSSCSPNDSISGLSVESGILWKKSQGELIFICPNGYAIPKGVEVPPKGKSFNFIHVDLVNTRYVTLNKEDNLIDEGNINSAIYSIANRVRWNGQNNVTGFTCIPIDKANNHKTTTLSQGKDSLVS